MLVLTIHSLLRYLAEADGLAQQSVSLVSQDWSSFVSNPVLLCSKECFEGYQSNAKDEVMRMLPR